jgi:hypothetical protein
MVKSDQMYLQDIYTLGLTRHQDNVCWLNFFIVLV